MHATCLSNLKGKIDNPELKLVVTARDSIKQGLLPVITPQANINTQ